MSGVRPPANDGYQPLRGGPEEPEQRPSGRLSRMLNGARNLVSAIPVGGSGTPLDSSRVSVGITSHDDKVKQIREHLIPKE